MASTYPHLSSAYKDIPLSFKIVDMGINPSSDDFKKVLDEITKAWAKDIEPLMRDPALSFKDQLKSDATNAAYRVASTQLLNVTKNFLIELARKSLSEEGKVRAIVELLDTEIGLAVMSMFIGTAVSQVPRLSSNPKVNRILKELRVGGMTAIGNNAFEALLSSILPVVVSAIEGVEKEEVVAENSLMEEELIISSELEETAPLQRQS